MILLKSNTVRRIVNGLSRYSRSKNQPNNQFPGITCGIIASLFYHIKIIMKILFFLLGLLLYSVELSASPPGSFPQAKSIVYKLFAKHPQTLYCNCRFDSKHQVDLDSCHMSSASDKKRAHKVEIEHMATADVIGHSLACWQNSICEHHGKPYKGRKCCEQMDGKFRQIESELYNLWPAVGLVNIARSN